MTPEAAQHERDRQTPIVLLRSCTNVGLERSRTTGLSKRYCKPVEPERYESVAQISQLEADAFSSVATRFLL
jgi:hypothetical protein